LKIIRRLGIGLLVLFILLFIAAIFLSQYLKPDYDGVKSLPGLNAEVSVYFDAYGIPHIYAENEADAFRALGYVHAQDRLWQMELLRRVAGGGLSEVFGRELSSTDRFFLALGIDDNSRKTVAQLDQGSPEVRLATAYLEGVNQFIETGPTPIEFYLTGLEKTPFNLQDIHNAIGYMAFSFAMAHKTDPFLSMVKDSLGAAYLQDLEIGYDSLTTRIRNYIPARTDSVGMQISEAFSTALGHMPVPQFIGSNSWVISPEKTRNGKVIFANDPHIGFAQPSVWYEAHIVTPGYEKYGFHLAGIPYPLLGHNRELAYGLTMLENDDIDFYYEKPHPTDSTRYMGPNGYTDYTYTRRKIRVKDSKDVEFTTRSTWHGPVMNDIAEQITATSPVSMSWVYTSHQNDLLRVLYEMSHARGIDDFEKVLPELHAPGLNIMYGDADGNIAWWASAHLYSMPGGTNTKLIIESGSMGDSIQWLDFGQNPKAINPPWNYVYSANNQPEPLEGRVYPGYYLPENRARRIVEILESKDDWDQKSVSAMILDDTSPVDPEIVTNLSKALDVSKLTDEEIKLLDLLSHWKGNYPLKSVAPVIFHRWVYFFLKNTFHDELGDTRFKQLLATHFHKKLIAPMAGKDSSVWWDNTRTRDTVERKDDIVHLSFSQAIGSLKKQLGPESEYWSWDRVHLLEHEHPMGRVAVLRPYFNVGPFPVRGSREVLNNMAFNYDEEGMNTVHHGPSTRRIIDFTAVENSMSILPTGQSGNPFSPHYKDQAEMFVLGKFRKMMLNREEILDTSESLLIFKTQ
jgi:penicillin amidase